MKNKSGPISSWREFLKVDQYFDQRQRRRTEKWVFRGQPSIAYTLQPSLEREGAQLGIKGQDMEAIERAVIKEFRRSYHLYGGGIPPSADDTLEWLALMRHHGAPRRLLDFSFSFFMAGFFALEHAGRKSDSAVWAVDKNWLTRVTRAIISANVKHGDKLWNEFNETRSGSSFRRIYMPSERVLPIVGPVGPWRLNQRLVLQQGLFLCPGDVTSPFHSALSQLPGSAEHVVCIRINRGCRRYRMRKTSSISVDISIARHADT